MCHSFLASVIHIEDSTHTSIRRFTCGFGDECEENLLFSKDTGVVSYHCFYIYGASGGEYGERHFSLARLSNTPNGIINYKNSGALSIKSRTLFKTKIVDNKVIIVSNHGGKDNFQSQMFSISGRKLINLKSKK